MLLEYILSSEKNEERENVLAFPCFIVSSSMVQKEFKIAQQLSKMVMWYSYRLFFEFRVGTIVESLLTILIRFLIFFFKIRECHKRFWFVNLSVR